MRNFKLTLEYDGTDFCGWQTQAVGLRTVQNHLEEKLERIFKRKIHCQASGRTDSGVHALGQVANFKIHTAMSPALIRKALNNFVDKDLSVLKVQEVRSDFHPQKDVKAKTYCYTILNRAAPSALWRNRAYFYPQKLDATLMRKAAGCLKGRHDFKGFQGASKASKRKNSVRTVKSLTIVKEGGLIRISITADGFLYKMARNIVGSLIAVGSGRLPVDSVIRQLKGKDRALAPRTAPSNGLCLVSVRYCIKGTDTFIKKGKEIQ